MDRIDSHILNYYLENVRGFLRSQTKKVQSFPGIEKNIENVLVEIAVHYTYPGENLDDVSKSLLEDIKTALIQNKNQFELTCSFQELKCGTRSLIYTKKKVNAAMKPVSPVKQPLPMLPLRKPNSLKSKLSEPPSALISSSFKLRCLNSTLKFVKDDSALTLRYPDMASEQADFIVNMFQQSTKADDSTDIGLGYKTMYAPLWEAMKIFSLKYKFTLRHAEPKSRDMKCLVLDKLPIISKSDQNNRDQQIITPESLLVTFLNEQTTIRKIDYYAEKFKEKYEKTNLSSENFNEKYEKTNLSSENFNEKYEKTNLSSENFKEKYDKINLSSESLNLNDSVHKKWPNTIDILITLNPSHLTELFTNIFNFISDQQSASWIMDSISIEEVQLLRSFKTICKMPKYKPYFNEETKILAQKITDKLNEKCFKVKVIVEKLAVDDRGKLRKCKKLKDTYMHKVTLWKMPVSKSKRAKMANTKSAAVPKPKSVTPNSNNVTSSNNIIIPTVTSSNNNNNNVKTTSYSNTNVAIASINKMIMKENASSKTSAASVNNIKQPTSLNTTVNKESITFNADKSDDNANNNNIEPARETTSNNIEPAKIKKSAASNNNMNSKQKEITSSNSSTNVPSASNVKIATANPSVAINNNDMNTKHKQEITSSNSTTNVASRNNQNIKPAVTGSNSSKSVASGNKLNQTTIKLIEGLNQPVNSDKAMRIMLNMGWSGGGLGAREEGITEPIAPGIDYYLDKRGRLGFGGLQVREEIRAKQQKTNHIKENHINIKENHINVKENHINVKENHINVKENHINVKENHINVKENHINLQAQQNKLTKREYHIHSLETILKLLANKETFQPMEFPRSVFNKEWSFVKHLVRCFNMNARQELCDERQMELYDVISGLMAGKTWKLKAEGYHERCSLIIKKKQIGPLLNNIKTEGDTISIYSIDGRTMKKISIGNIQSEAKNKTDFQNFTNLNDLTEKDENINKLYTPKTNCSCNECSMNNQSNSLKSPTEKCNNTCVSLSSVPFNFKSYFLAHILLFCKQDALLKTVKFSYKLNENEKKFIMKTINMIRKSEKCVESALEERFHVKIQNEMKGHIVECVFTSDHSVKLMKINKTGQVDGKIEDVKENQNSEVQSTCKSLMISENNSCQVANSNQVVKSCQVTNSSQVIKNSPVTNSSQVVKTSQVINKDEQEVEYIFIDGQKYNSIDDLDASLLIRSVNNINNDIDILLNDGQTTSKTCQVVNKSSQVVNTNSQVVNKNSQVVNTSSQVTNENSQVANKNSEVVNSDPFANNSDHEMDDISVNIASDEEDYLLLSDDDLTKNDLAKEFQELRDLHKGESSNKSQINDPETVKINIEATGMEDIPNAIKIEKELVTSNQLLNDPDTVSIKTDAKSIEEIPNTIKIEKEFLKDPSPGKRSRSDSECQTQQCKKSKNYAKKIAIVPKTYPKEKITEKSAREIQTLIRDSIDNFDSLTELPFLKCNGLENGMLLYCCYSEKSFYFIEDLLNKRDFKLIYGMCKKPGNICMTLKINSYLLEEAELTLNRLVKYNKGLSTKEWKIIKRLFSKESDLFLIEMDLDSYNYIREANFSLFAGIDKAVFSHHWD